VRGLQTIDPAYFCRPDPGSSNPTPENKSLLVLFFRKEQNLLFLKKKKQKDFFPGAVPAKRYTESSPAFAAS
jgi:hypothetical protein